jgi:hypothetical protein
MGIKRGHTATRISASRFCCPSMDSTMYFTIRMCVYHEKLKCRRGKYQAIGVKRRRTAARIGAGRFRCPHIALVDSAVYFTVRVGVCFEQLKRKIGND